MATTIYELVEELEEIDGSKKTWNDCVSFIKKYEEKESIDMKKRVMEGEVWLFLFVSLMTGSLSMTFKYIGGIKGYEASLIFLIFFLVSSLLLFLSLYKKNK